MCQIYDGDKTNAIMIYTFYTHFIYDSRNLTCLFRCPAVLPPGGDVLTDLAEDGAASACGSHVRGLAIADREDVLLRRALDCEWNFIDKLWGCGGPIFKYDGERIRKAFRKKLILLILIGAFSSRTECVYWDYGQGSLSYSG